MPLLTLATGAALALRARKATPLAFVTSAGGGSLAMTVQMARPRAVLPPTVAPLANY